MKTKQLRIYCILIVLISTIKLNAQQVPTNNDPAGIPGGLNNKQFWSRVGNNNSTSQNNIFGTMWNSPIYTYSNGINRMIINGDKTPTINAFNVNTSGYVGIGNPNYSPLVGGGPFWSNKGPFSLLHLNGDGGGSENGYRPWMQTGITFTEGFDLSYLGNRVVDGVGDRNEFTMAWSNDPTSTQYGPDDMVFRFLSGRAPGAAGSTINTDFSLPNDLDGRHIARFTGNGEMGLGNTFGLVQSGVGYVRPQSLLHMSLFNLDAVWMQITNQNGTNQTANDGLRLGIEAGNNSPAYLRWQERTPFIIQTDWNNNAGGINNGERMRISSVGAPNVPNPNGANNNNITRVSISHKGNSPVTEPRSLLHLGYNTGNGFPLGGIVDGWRDWMDIGTFTNNGTDNIYVGLKEEGVDRFDAVINWGDNQVAGTTPNGPDNLRFIFTSTTTALPPGQGDPVSQSNDGLETARFEPTAASTIPTNYGMMGIGNFSPTGPNTAAQDVVDAKLDIDGDLRIRTVTQRDTLLQVLVIDSNDHNRVHWRNIGSLGGAVVGNYCSQPQNPLTGNYEIPLNNFNYYFTGNGLPNTNSVSVGTPCNTVLPAKLVSYQNAGATVGVNTIAGGFLNEDVANTPFLVFRGVYGEASGNQTIGEIINIGGNFVARNATWRNIGVRGIAQSGTNISSITFGGIFAASNSIDNFGVWASAPVTGASRAGFFNGDVEIINGMLVSDKKFKTDINNIKGATDVLRKLKPSTFKMDIVGFPQFNFQDRKQYGFIAQEVESVLPDLVHDSYMPAELDSLGNEVYPAVSYKSLNYNAIIPITVQAVNEITERIDKSTLSDQNVKTNVQTLTNSLDKVKQMRGVSYEWSNDAQNNMNLDSLQHIGFIAQEVAAIE
ncbi:MAG: tail fiber domain-containing protein, partial [Flavobacteriales bacterium]|nr:tail fiber domain-containing protein [Flavobacteriales bacterium]